MCTLYAYCLEFYFEAVSLRKEEKDRGMTLTYGKRVAWGKRVENHCFR